MTKGREFPKDLLKDLLKGEKYKDRGVT